MHSSIFNAAVARALFLTPMAANAVSTAFILAKDMSCAVTISGSEFVQKGGSGISFGTDCFTGASVVPQNGWNCHNLQNPTFQLQAGDANYNTFHVTSKTGNVCGVGRWDAYKDCDNCSNWGLFVAGGDGTKKGYCYPIPHGGKSDTCYAPPFSTDVWGEFVHYDIWDAPAVC